MLMSSISSLHCSWERESKYKDFKHNVQVVAAGKGATGLNPLHLNDKHISTGIYLNANQLLSISTAHIIYLA